MTKGEPAIGWVRGNELADKEATQELLKLRKRVEELTEELDSARTSAPKGTEKLSQGEERHTLKYTFRARELERYHWLNWQASFSPTWDDIFSYISPLMIHEASNPQIKASMDTFAEEQNIEKLRENEQIGNTEIRNFSIRSDDFQTVIIQLRALGLITKSVKNRSVKDTETYWKLTPYGDEIMTRLRAIERDEVEPEEDGLEELEDNEAEIG